MKSKIIYLLLITLVVTNCVMLFILIKKPHKRHQGKGGSFLVKKLDLNSEQEKHFFEFDKEHRFKMDHFDDEILKNKKLLFESFSNSEKINDTIVLRIGTLTGKREEEVIAFFSKIKSICNEEQVEKLKKVISRALNHSRSHMQGSMHPSHKGMHPSPPVD